MSAKKPRARREHDQEDPDRRGGGHQCPRFRLAHRLRERGNHLEHVADDAVVRDLEDRRLVVLVDRDDRLRGAHAGQVLDRAGDADRDVQLRTHLPPGLADLVAVRTPPVIRHGARRADGRVAERRGEILDELEVLRRP